MAHKQDMGTGSVKKHMLHMAVPAVIAQAINLLYNIVDRIYIGHIPEIGGTALTGVGLFTPILMLITAFAMMSVGNAADAYFMSYNVGATPLMTTAFMWLGTIPAFIFMPMVPAIKRKIGKKGMFYLFLGTAIVGMAMMYVFVQVEALKRFDLLCIAQFVKSTGIIVATGYMWVLVPEVVSYGEYTSGRRIAGIVNALTGIFFKAGMALGGVVPGLVLAWVGFNAELPKQTALAEQGILWLVCVIPAILLLLAMFIISKYELSDEVIDKINREIEQRNK